MADGKGRTEGSNRPLRTLPKGLPVGGPLRRYQALCRQLFGTGWGRGLINQVAGAGLADDSAGVGLFHLIGNGRDDNVTLFGSSCYEAGWRPR